MRLRSPIAFTTLLLAVSLVFLGMATGFESGTRGVPVCIAALLSLLVTLQVLRDVRTARAAPSDAVWVDREPASDPDGTADMAIGPGTAEDLESAALRWLLFLAVSLALLGMLAGPAIFVALYLRRRGGEAWPIAVAGGAAAVAMVWLVMTQAIAAPIPGGWAGSLVAAAFGGSG